MFGRFAPRLGRTVALAALCLLPAPTASGASAPPSRRCAAAIAHFDSTVGRTSSDSLWRWVAALEEGAPAGSDLRVVAGVQRARLLVQMGRNDEARPLAEAARVCARAARDTLLECRALYVLGMSLALQERPVEARPLSLRLSRLAHAAGLRRDEGQAHLTLAYLDLLANRFAAAERGYREALRAYSPTLDVIPRRIARVGLARACFQQGRVDEARRTDIELIRESRGVNDPVNESMALNNLAVHELLGGDPADAIPCYRRALLLQRGLGRWREAMTTANNLAAALTRMARYDEAVEALESYRDTARAGVQAWQRVDRMSQLAAIRFEQGRPDQAEALATRAWALCDSAHLRPGRHLAATRARLMARRGAALEAVALLDRWVKAIPDDEPDPDDALMAQAEAASLLPTAGHAEEALRRWDGIASRIDTSSALGHLKLAYALVNESIAASGIHDLPRARSTLRVAVREWERGRSNYRSAEWRELLEARGMFAWGSAAGALMVDGRGRRTEAGARAAFDLLQHLKARTLDDRMTAVPSARPVTAEALQRRTLRDGELALDLVPAYDSLLVFAVTKRSVRLYVLADRDDLQRRVQRFAELARDPAPASAVLRENAGRSLSATLLGPVADLLAGSRCMIVSAGAPADQLPWALLPEPGSGRPLIDRLGLSNVPSLSALARLRGTRAVPASRGPLVVAGPTGPDGRRLDGVEQEVSFLRGRYATADVRTPRSRAEIRGVLAAMGGVEVIHVAAHFDHDPEDPWHTGMLLGDPRRDESWVRPAELSSVRLRARLATLAGCASAGAQRVRMDGERGLATAFLAAGSQAVVGTLWPVEDEASAELVRRFYRALDEGHDAGHALALAQAGMRDSFHGEDASRWAGFVLLGDPAVRVSLPRRKALSLPGFGRP